MEKPAKQRDQGHEHFEICARAIKHYGAAAQKEMLIEECAELIQALQHEKRGRINPEEVCEEIADVQIMLNQISLLYPERLIKKAFERKMSRLKSRMMFNDQKP